ncbi:MAG TPA: hypothetical protein VLA67_09885 [Nitrospiraceae bacterium]|nr:hypothetical protein [Nitrospiraceae bacterium]
MVLPANQQPPPPLEPRKEPFDEPAALVPASVAPVLGLEFPSRPVRRDQVHAVLLEVIIESVAVIRAIANELLRLGLQHVEVETELHQGDLMMIGGMRTDRERQPVSIDNRQDFHALATFREADRVAATLRGGKRRVDEALALIERPFLAQRVGQLRDSRECRRLVDIALQSYSVIKTGHVGVTGATGTLLFHTLEELRALADRSLPEIRLAYLSGSVAHVGLSIEKEQD